MSTAVETIVYHNSNEVDLSPEEQMLLQYFQMVLRRAVLDCDGAVVPWEIYGKPYLNGIQPSFVLLNPLVGVALFEVASLDRHETVKEHPLDKLNRARDAIVALYCPSFAMRAVENKQAWAIVSRNLVVTDRTPDQIRGELTAFEVMYRLSISRTGAENVPPEMRSISAAEPVSKYLTVVSLDEVRKNHRLFPSILYRTSQFMEPRLASELRGWLGQPGESSTPVAALPLDRDQRRLVTEREPLRRRVRGPAGSGKSQVLAARASLHSGNLNQVLVLSFNITIWHYLRALARTYDNPNARLATNVEWNHFHQWCIDRRMEAGLRKEYEDLWENFGTDQVLTHELPNLTSTALQITKRKYDAILIDEGQDFEYQWWELVRSTMKPRGGRAFLVADQTQDLYGKVNSWSAAENFDRQVINWTDADDLRGTGFRTNWQELENSYRLPLPLIWQVRDFAEQQLGESAILPDLSLQAELWHCSMKWIQVDRGALLEDFAVQELLKLHSTRSTSNLTPGDLVLLTSTRGLGIRCVDKLRDQRFFLEIQDTFADPKRVCIGIPTSTREGREKCQIQCQKIERLKKIAFVETKDRPRVTTVKSFKGWEARAIVVVIEPDMNLNEVYVALTRLKRDERGSFLTVVCAEPSLAEIGHSWNLSYP